MKFKSLILFAIFFVLIFVVSCGGSNAEGGNAATSETTCTHAEAFNCKENAVFKCENKEWQKIEQCAEDQKCNAVKGICENIDGDITPENPDTDDADTNQDTDTDSSDTKPENPDTDEADTLTQENPDKDDADPSTDDGDSEAVEINDEASCIAAGGAWSSGKCTKSVSCTGLPENASWNKATGIRQTWNGTEWEPSETGSYSETPSTSECVFKCKTNYEWNAETSTCEGASRSADCTELPANAQWNTVSEITQTWSGSAWLPDTTGVYNESASEDECRFKCAINYTWNGSSCAADTRSADCLSKPANTVWNDNDRNGKFTQTWNGSDWAPATYASGFSKTAGTCKYVCVTGYIWSENQCITAPTQTASCTGLPANAEWNTVSSITQTYDGAEWFPGTTGVYNETASTIECRYKCQADYHRDNSACISNTKTASCTGLPSNAQWNTASSITQTWNGSTWTPTATGSFNNTASTSECRYKCKTNYTWTNSVCKADSRVSNCTGLPANAQWNTVSTISQTWNGTSWQPSTAGTYNTTASTSECRYKCKSGYFWDGSLCKISISLGEICTHQTSCYNASSSMTCPSSSSADFYGQDAQYTSKCTAQSFSSSSNVVVDNNTGLTWEKSPSSSTYTWANRNTHCSDLNSSNYGGKSNWRVPNPLELLTIVDNSTYNLATNSNFTNMPTGSSDYLWTSKEYGGDTSLARAFNPYYGQYTYGHSKTSTYKVLCVSGDELTTATSSYFTTSSDGKIVTDSRTGLMWQKEYATGKTWQQALKYCEDSTYAGYSDWRLPNKNELASLLDPGKSGAPYSNFPDMPSNWFWSSSTGVYNTSYAWRVLFGYGYVDSYSKLYSNSVRCVR